MQIIDNIIILLLPVIAFMAGKKLSDNYHRDIIAQYEYQLRLMAAEKGVGYIAPPQKNYIGQPFMDRLKTYGRATQSLKSQQSEPDGASACKSCE